MRSKRGVLLVAGLSIPLAQVGHVLAYGFRVPASGAHAYFPLALQAAGAFIGTGLLAALAVLVLARLLAGPVARRRPWSFALLASGLLAGQLTVFLIQESVEWGGMMPNAASLALGLLAQQPVALLAALALHWLSARLGPALEAVAAPRRPGGVLVLASHPTPAPAFAPVPLAPARPRPIRGQRAPPL